MAPNVKGETFAWLDRSTLYINAATFEAVVDDLVAPFDPAEVDVVAGFDAMGFVLGTAIAVRLGKGFLTLRKAGKMPVETDAVEFLNYSGRMQEMEVRTPAFRPGTRVLLVDQWVETGGTMGAGIRLVERQGGVVAGDRDRVHRGERTHPRPPRALPVRDLRPARERVAASVQRAVARLLRRLRPRRLHPGYRFTPGLSRANRTASPATGACSPQASAALSSAMLNQAPSLQATKGARGPPRSRSGRGRMRRVRP